MFSSGVKAKCSIDAGLEMENVSGIQLTDDQYFLLYLIMGAYFGPDLKGARSFKSALQRRAEELPQYSANDLTGSHMRTVEIERVYYYIVRKAEESVVVKQPFLLLFIHGHRLPLAVEGSATCPQFDDLFPPTFHRHRSQFENQFDTIDNIVFIPNPEIGYINPRDIERFKRLTGLGDFLVDRESALLDVNRVVYNVKAQEIEKLDESEQCVNHVPCTGTNADGSELSNFAVPLTPRVTSEMTTTSTGDLNEGMIFLSSCPSREEWSKVVADIKGGFAVTGSAARGNVGPVLGLIDIGESADSYLFRVSLPGVKRDEKDFSCEVEDDGTVMIKGVTVTGERRFEKYYQEFEMQSQNLCPPGPFSICFKLPGPVDPQQFHGTFASDGILEGIAFKTRRYRS